MNIQSSLSGAASGFPRSMHLGGTHGLFCDGSVRWVSDFVECCNFLPGGGPYVDFLSGNPDRLKTWERLNTSADGLPVEEDDLSP